MCKKEQCVNQKENIFDVKLNCYAAIVAIIAATNCANDFNTKYCMGLAKGITIAQLVMTFGLFLLFLCNSKIDKYINQKGVKVAESVLTMGAALMMLFGLVMQLISMFAEDVQKLSSMLVLFLNGTLVIIPFFIIVWFGVASIFSTDRTN